MNNRASESLPDYLSKLDKISSELENKRNTHVILMIFHENVPITRDVVDDLAFFLEGREFTRDIDVVLQTRGGDADAAYHIGILLQKLAKERVLSFIIPRMAKSAGTLLACSGDRIIMTPISELGPVDPQVYVENARRWISARVIRDSFEQTLEATRDKILNELINTIKGAPGMEDAVSSVVRPFTQAVLSEIPITELGHYNSLIDHAKSLLVELLSNRMFKQAGVSKESTGFVQSSSVHDVAEKLVSEYRYHGKVIHLDEAKTLGLRIEELPDEELKIVFDLYRSIRELFGYFDEIIMPFESVLGRSPPTIAYRLEHGLLYGPKIES